MEDKIKTDDLKGNAIPFVIYSNKKFIVTEEAKEVLSRPQYKNIGIISLVGKYRTGKSFLLNRVLLNQKQDSGFGVASTIRPCTKGIWMWTKPNYIENNHCKEKFPVFMIDTEGLGAYDEEINHDTKIFLIAVLISSVFIFNSFGNIDENSINSLSFILNLSKTIKLKESTGGDPNIENFEISKYFPSLLWVLRDFSLKLEDTEGNTITAKQYLENALILQKGSSDIVEEKNKVRKMITAYFPERDCFSMVRPVENEVDLQNLQTLDDSKIRKEFIEQAETLRNKVSKKVKPKVLNNRILSGSMLVELLTSIIDSINQGAIPVIENSWKYVAHNESIKSINSAMKEYINLINKFKHDNKDNPSFFGDLEIFQNNLQKKLIDEFLKSMIMDENSTVEYVNQLKGKISEEYKKFNEENSRFFESKLTDGLERNSKKLCDAFETEKYSRNYYQFFQDIENLKEITELSTPDFPLKKEIIFEKLLMIIKKFIEMTFLKNKISNEKEIVTLKNELQSITNKHIIMSGEFDSLRYESKENIEKLNKQIVEFKINEKSQQDKCKQYETEKKQLINNTDKKFNDYRREMEDTVEKLRKDCNKIEQESKNKEDQIMMLKFNEEKMGALNKQKMEFLEKEIISYKERYDDIKSDVKEYRATIDELNLKIEELKNENKKLKILEEEIEKLRNITPKKEEVVDTPDENFERSRSTQRFLFSSPSINNSEIVLLLKSQMESYKHQIEETKKFYDNILEEIKSQNTQNKIEENNETLEANKTLFASLSNYESRYQKLEEKIIKLKLLKTTYKCATALQCKFCSKLFTYEIFKSHSQKCETEILKNSITNFNNEKEIVNKLKIKILKGVLNKDELGKPYIEYILEITYNSQTWRVNKKFNQFANLNKTLVSLFSEIKFPEFDGIFSKLNMNGKESNNHHEVKIKQIEKYLKDISHIGIINKSKPFRKFFDFDIYVDENVIGSNYIIINSHVDEIPNEHKNSFSSVNGTKKDIINFDEIKDFKQTNFNDDDANIVKKSDSPESNSSNPRKIMINTIIPKRTTIGSLINKIPNNKRPSLTNTQSLNSSMVITRERERDINNNINVIKSKDTNSIGKKLK